MECERYTLRRADVAYGVSDYVTNWPLVQRYAKNIYGTIYNIPHQASYEENPGHIREALGIAQEDIVIVSTGRITREKGYDVLCNTMLKWHPQPNVKFVFAGEGEYLPLFKKRIEESSLSKQAFFLGFRKDIAAILRESNVFVLCTRHETLCNSILEACQEALPVVATNVGGIPEIIADRENGF